MSVSLLAHGPNLVCAITNLSYLLLGTVQVMALPGPHIATISHDVAAPSVVFSGPPGIYPTYKD